ncbi:MAG: GNAT family N-acetyltransferase [Gammaproteobacteria bacterium]
MNTLVHRSVHEIPASDWDALVGDCAVVRSHAYVAAIEEAAVVGCRWLYPVVRNAAGEVLAHAVICIVATDLVQALPPGLTRAARLLRRFWPGFLRARIAECGAPMVAAHGLGLRPGYPQSRLLAALAQAIEAEARDARCQLVVFRDFGSDEPKAVRRLSRRGYRRMTSVPLARVNVRWPSHDGYLAAMRSRYRKDLRRHLARAAADGQQVRVLQDFGRQADLWAAQAEAIQASSKGFRRETPTPAYYRNLDAALGERSVVVAAEKEGRFVAHGMVLFDGENAVATYFGREPGPPSAEWFHLLNEALGLGIERGCSYVHLGRGSYDAKALAGAEIEPLHVYCRCTGRLLNLLLGLAPDIVAWRPLRPRRVFHEA